MANNPTVGIFLPGGYLNNYNTTVDTGQADAYGNVYWTGSNVGKMIEVGDNYAANTTSPGTTNGTYGTPSGLPLFGGAYQIVQVDSGATAANVAYGAPAFIRVDSGVTQGALPETSYANIVVTTADIQGQIGGSYNLFAGIFVNSITPGNFGLLFVGAGRCAVAIASGNSGGTGIGTPLLTNTNNPNFITAAATTTGVLPSNVGVVVSQPVTAGGYAVGYFPNIFYRLPGV